MSELAILTVNLKHGIKLRGTVHKSVVLREPLLDDMIAAEEEANSALTPLAYRRALVARQIVKLGDTDVPVTPGMLGKLKGADWAALSAGLHEVQQLGEAGSDDGRASSAESC
ncbi:phage tail assembly protein [Chromobacterium phragmitis]|uniref:Phage tail assembly protein n=1 Tax=Chromobacterium phragmitis TaxID=2202141 RepID=A0ABV0IVK4_9NEIS